MSFWIFTDAIKHLKSLTDTDMIFSQVLLPRKFLKMPATPPAVPQEQHSPVGVSRNQNPNPHLNPNPGESVGQ